ncbi:MAG: DUF1724 domain-containing protein [Methanobacterium paludis]|nr:DUF1724 domain-containing protein [Methanobacterium paludis]
MVDIEDIFEIYENTKDDMKFFTASEVRAKILISLTEGPKNLADLRSDIHRSPSTILHGMNQLREKELVFRESGQYSLSQTGEILTNKIIDTTRAVNSVNTCKCLFLNHEIKSIPQSLIKDIGCLSNAYTVKSTSIDILKPHTTLSNLLSKTKNVKHLSSVFYPQIAELFLKVIENNVKLDLILTEEVLNKFIGMVGVEKLKKPILAGDLKLWIVDDGMKIFFTMGDNFISMGLFSTEGSYDVNVFLISENEDCDGEEAISWGNRLFNHYLRSAKEFKPEF